MADYTDRYLNVNHRPMPEIYALMSAREQLALVNNLSDCLHEHSDISAIANAAVAVMANSCGNPSVSMAEVKGEHLVFLAHQGFSAKFMAGRQRVSILDDIWPCLVVRSKCAKVSANIATDDTASAAVKAAYDAEHVKSGMILPLLHQGEVKGILAIAYSRENCVGEDMQSLFETVGNILSLALVGAHHVSRTEYISQHDPLTGLANRACLFELGHQVLSDALVLVDINRFKEINNNLGHDIGDAVLRSIGPRIQEAIGEIGAILYSFGGDSFAVLIPHLGDVPANVVVEKVDQALRLPFLLAGLNLELSVSLGYACADGSANDSIELYRRADIALAMAKSQGGGLVAYHASLESDKVERLAILADLGDAIREDQLQLFYQPKLDLRSGAVVGCEALLRWQHPVHGMLPPDKFIPIVEASQWMNPLTRWVIKTALKQAYTWREQGLDISVAVNLSPRNLEDAHCASMVAEQLRLSTLDARYLELEVTETALMQNPEESLLQVQKLGALGIQFALDDYGTGYSSLTYIRDLTLASLKIDRSFISQMLNHTADRVIVESTINMAHNLGLKVVAEGIEDLATAEALTLMGCDIAQGYYFSRPLPAADFYRWIQAREG